MRTGDQVESIHGTLVSVFGVGVLLTGPAEVGKSTIALGLIDRGHSLVADDVVLLSGPREGPVGSCPPNFHGILSVRPLGSIDVGMVFGLAAVAGPSEIRLVVDVQDNGDAATGRMADEFRLAYPQVRFQRVGVGGTTDRALLVETAVRAYFITEALVELSDLSADSSVK